MSLRSVLLLALSVYFTFSSVFCSSSSALAPHPASSRSGCFKVNTCQCIMKDGSGVINLEAMGDAEGFLGRLRPVTGEKIQGEMLLSFSPCLPFTPPDQLTGSDCTDVAACLTVRLSTYVGYGRHEGNKFHYNDTLKMLSVSYFAQGEEPLTVVHYHCSPNRSSSLVLDQRLGTEGLLQIWVESPCACPNACTMGDLGIGTIFLIILSVSAAAYFILGSCALRPFRSSGGVQISPEHSVWCMICYLCAERRHTRSARYTDATRP